MYDRKLTLHVELERLMSINKVVDSSLSFMFQSKLLERGFIVQNFSTPVDFRL